MEEHERLYQMTVYERTLWEKGLTKLGGMDEVGRGPLAGPVVAACIIFPPEVLVEGVNDSKKISEKKRERLYDLLMKQALAIGIGQVDPGEVDRINILNATRKAMVNAVNTMDVQPEHLLIDAISELDILIPQSGIIKGDEKSYTIAAASIIAKVTRDRMMIEYDRQYPEYGFKKNKGYGTKEHIHAIKEYGPCPIHRRSFITRFSSFE